MNKEESGLLGCAIVTLLIFAYGLKTNRGWKYWVFSMLFIAPTGGMIGIALGKDQPKPQSNEQDNKAATQA